MDTLYITWDVDPFLVDLGFVSIRYYTLLFGAGLFLAAWVVYRIFRDKQIPEADFFSLGMYVFWGIVLGARLGHCLFYEPEYYLTRPLEMLLPFSFENGEFTVTGYRGLASHGGSAGVIIALALFCYRKKKYNAIRLLDYIAIGTPLAAAFIRFGNLMNSEIIGRATTVPWAFRFLQDDGLPRHPAQLYEGLFYLALFFVNWLIYKKAAKEPKTGFFFGFTIVMIFTFRFFIEFIKENQVGFEDSIPLNMGQLLSIPFILAGLYFMLAYKREKRNV